MGVCSDSRLTVLNSLGDNVVRLPRAGLEPLHALGRDPKAGSLADLCVLSTILKTERTPPTPGPNPFSPCCTDPNAAFVVTGVFNQLRWTGQLWSR